MMMMMMMMSGTFTWMYVLGLHVNEVLYKFM